MTENIQEEIEDKIIDCINFGVAGRLIIFKPEKNNIGADLAVERRGKYKEEGIYLKINSLITSSGLKEHSDNFVKDFLQENFPADQNFYLLFVPFDEVSQKINDYIWLMPSLYFRDAAEVIKLPDGKNLLRFKASLNFEKKDEYSKFITSTKGLGKLILSALENNGKFDFKENNGRSTLNLDSLKEFLRQARKNTYAASATSVDNPRLLSSTQLEFQKGDYFYRDIYFSGDKKFIGQEIVYQESKPVWAMNYIGDQIGKTETKFLKESLSKLSEKCRFGEVCEYKKRDFKYQDQGQGNFVDFFGKEEIFTEGKSIYKLNYQGGLL